MYLWKEKNNQQFSSWVESFNSNSLVFKGRITSFVWMESNDSYQYTNANLFIVEGTYSLSFWSICKLEISVCLNYHVKLCCTSTLSIMISLCPNLHYHVKLYCNFKWHYRLLKNFNHSTNEESMILLHLYFWHYCQGPWNDLIYELRQTALISFIIVLQSFFVSCHLWFLKLARPYFRRCW